MFVLKARAGFQRWSGRQWLKNCLESPPMHHVDIVTLGLLLFIACLVAIVTRRIGLPYAIGLVVAGIGLTLAGYASRINLTPE